MMNKKFQSLSVQQHCSTH